MNLALSSWRPTNQEQSACMTSPKRNANRCQLQRALTPLQKQSVRRVWAILTIASTSVLATQMVQLSSTIPALSPQSRPFSRLIDARMARQSTPSWRSSQEANRPHHHCLSLPLEVQIASSKFSFITSIPCKELRSAQRKWKSSKTRATWKKRKSFWEKFLARTKLINYWLRILIFLMKV